MWTLNLHAPLGDPITATVSASGRAMTNAEIVEAWCAGGAFPDFWSEALAALPFDAFCWEMPPLTAAAWQRPFECMVFDSPMLARMPADAVPFEEHFGAACARGIVAFENYGRDALLVAPCPVDDTTDHAHLAAFLRTASREQARALWGRVAEAVREREGAGPLWVSTAGLGVAWLHVRLSTVPKYYRSQAYARSVGA